MRTPQGTKRFARAVLLCIAAVFSIALFMGTAGAQTEPYSEEPPAVLPTRITQPGQADNPDEGGGKPGSIEQPDAVQPNRVHRSEKQPNVKGIQVQNDQGGGVLPFTGADLSLFLTTGVTIVGTGALLIRRTRPSRRG